MSTFEAAVEELKALPPCKLAAAAQYIHSLQAESRSERLAAAQAAAGMLSPDDADAMEKALASCRRVDADGW